MPTDLTELIERLEKATGPDRELDAAIRDALYSPSARVGWPPYTASLDAALALVEEKLPCQWVRLDYWTDINIERPRASILPKGELIHGFAAHGATLPLALLLALLRALQSQSDRTDEREGR
jgi:hypothetical protein